MGEVIEAADNYLHAHGGNLKTLKTIEKATKGVDEGPLEKDQQNPG